jgi:hypothetical protein
MAVQPINKKPENFSLLKNSENKAVRAKSLKKPGKFAFIRIKSNYL